jgi:short-subunit dehydrogenase
MKMKNIALVTGASGGIGRELARIHAKQGGDLILVARRVPELDVLKKELEDQYGTTVVLIIKDLSESNSARQIYDEVNKRGIEPEILINNAGFGGHGLFAERDPEKELAMIQVNITSLVLLTRLFLPGMIQRRRGKILNVSSSASFLPGPLQAVYYASKAFVTSFSQALWEELRHTGVTTTALCPGPVDTGFFDTAGMHGIKLLETQKAASPEKTAMIGYRDMIKGKILSFDNHLLRFSLRWIIHFIPGKMLLRISRYTMEK